MSCQSAYCSNVSQVRLMLMTGWKLSFLNMMKSCRDQQQWPPPPHQRGCTKMFAIFVRKSPNSLAKLITYKNCGQDDRYLPTIPYLCFSSSKFFFILSVVPTYIQGLIKKIKIRIEVNCRVGSAPRCSKSAKLHLRN